MATHTVQSLSTGWEFRRSTNSTWLSAAQVPSEVHTELVRHGVIPDPFVDLNELKATWVSEETWHYRTTFATPTAEGCAGVTDLVFEGLDTFASVKLNGQTILQSDNMFVEHRVNVDKFLNSAASGTENMLEIVFESARRRGLEFTEAHPEHDFIVHQTEVSRGPVRKSQYHWGWDWGPILLTCGPWKPVRLETYVSRIEDIRVDYNITAVEEGKSAVEISLHAQVLGPAARLQIDLFLNEQIVCSFEGESGMSENGGIVSGWTYESGISSLEDAQLWWPRGYGPQSLYNIQLRAIADDGSTVLAEESQTIGFRKVELVQEKDISGQSFYFRVNDVDVFSGGSCWIPADSFVSRLDSQRYRDWIELISEGNQTMVRIWGGGIYEPGAFYAACDDLGILVWQDFMFACASYPTHPEYLSSVTTEARQNIRRLRNHPSVVIWCGNNEDYQLVERYDLDYIFEDKDPQSWLKTNFPARYIYEHLLPGLVREESRGSIYHPSSPWGNGKSTTLKVDPTVGDIHQWNVWHGDMKPYQKLPEMGGRFVSEFGMEAYPHLETMHKFITEPAERYPGSATIDFHNKAVGYERRLLTYLGENFRLKQDLPSFTHLTQVMQADAMSWAYKSWRRHWGSAGARRCGGVLVWQLNDCWPTISWSIVDYFMVKKPAYYAIKRAMAPLAVAVTRKFHDCTTRPADSLWRRDTGHVDPTKALSDISFDVWVSSSRLEVVQGLVVLRFVSIKTGQEVREKLEREVEIYPNSCTDVLADFKYEAGGGAGASKEHFVIHASLWLDGALVGSDASWPDPIKYLDFADRGVQVKRVDQSTVEITAEKPVKGFVFSERQGVKVSDNGFDLVPGEKPKVVRIEGGVADQLSWGFVGYDGKSS
ncbi:glycoside hydrolase family 2 protein [Podospora didyma]|uniref:Beta-mannosidase B n=1 Tax=Podospora didyma TaxID=330526 RepID=A0AAE0NI62_9PEZI|nr:glycoside hydrolase family 2 protein [Podospora didyma]